jgi:hypothetical protein
MNDPSHEIITFYAMGALFSLYLGICPINSQVLVKREQQAPAIVIGFVGGFVKNDDRAHREVQFAAEVRNNYSGKVQAEVFGNHQRAKAFRQVLLLLDTDQNGILTAAEKQQARIIIYGHSWGAMETLALARELQQEGIPVRLTIQIDSIAKPGQDASSIPSNVANAINFYQTHGLLHGTSEIRAMDPARTKILGNFHMIYKDHPVNCDGFPWHARLFTKPHIEIENDPRVWERIAALVDAAIVETQSSAQIAGTSR